MELLTIHRYSIMRRITMRTFDIILPENISLASKDRLAEMYNDAVQEIWYLSKENARLREENEMLWKAYDELSDQIYG